MSGEKFAQVLLHTHVGDGLAREASGTEFSIGPPISSTIDEDWAKWLGTIRIKEIAESNLVIEANLASIAPTVFDQASIDVKRIANHAYLGLLLTKNFLTFAAPTLLIGGRWVGGSSIRQVASLPRPLHEPAEISSELQQNHLAQAVNLGAKLLHLPGRKLWRLNRSLHLYRQARCESDGLERLHQYVRTLEGATKPPSSGGTTNNFVGRMAELAGEENRDLFRRLYDRRGAVEHLREHELLADHTRTARLNLVRDELTAEYLSRSILARIVDRQDLCDHFGTANSVDRFWAHSPNERQQIWGAQIDPSDALDGFDPSMLSNENLGLDP